MRTFIAGGAAYESLLRPKKSQKQKILELLSDGAWHSIKELNNIGYRYSARLAEIRKDGVMLQKRVGKDGFEEWRIYP